MGPTALFKHFKYVNSVVGHSFKVVFVEKNTCGAREQCTRRTQKTQKRICFPFQCNLNVH